MVRNLFILKFLIIFAFPVLAASVEFSAKVNTDKIATNEVVTLNVTLNNAVSENDVDFSKLKEKFEIVSSSNATSVEIINGHSASSKQWTFILKPKNDGVLEIPSFKLATASGEFSTDPIKIEVTKAVISNSARNGTIFVTSNVSNFKPYLNEPIIYQIQLYSVSDQHIEFNLSNLEIENAVFKPLGAYKVSDGYRAGKPVKIVEMTYLITPIKAGKITIPTQIVSGVVTYMQRKRASFSSLLGLDWDHDEKNSPSNHKQYFQVATTEVNLDVQPAAKGILPWLPSKSLEIKAELDTNKFIVGVPIRLSVSIKAKGLEKSQLPHFGAEMLKGEGYKIYAENVESVDNIDKMPITSVRKELYTIIPQQQGKITIPEITVKWWNTEKNRESVAVIPARTLEILPNNESSAQQSSNGDSSLPGQNIQSKALDHVNKSSNLTWLFVGVIFGIIVAASYFLFKRNKTSKAGIANQNSNYSSISDNPNVKIDQISSAGDLNKFLQNYANQHYNIPVNSSLTSIFNALREHKAITEQECYEIIKQLEGALYADKIVDLKLLKAKCKDLLKRANRRNIAKNNKKTLPDLNP